MLQDKCMKIIEKIKQLYFTFTIFLQVKFYFISFSDLKELKILNYVIML